MFTKSHGSVPVSCVVPKKEPEFAATDGGSDDGGGAGDDYVPSIGIDADGCYDYVTPKEEPELKCVDVYYHPVKEEPEPELGDGDGDAVDVKEEPQLIAAGDDTDADSDRDAGHDCSHCGISLSTREFRVEHELRCKILKEQKELESQVTKLYHCGYCRCPFINEELKEQHQQKQCRKRPVAKRKDFNGPFFSCDKCEYVAKWKYTLEKHLLMHNKNNAEWFTCKWCSYRTVHKSDMTRHAKTHVNTFRCCRPICGKSFRRKKHLDDHLVRQHLDEWDEVSKRITSKTYTCNICDKYRTISKTDFKEHVTVTHHKGVAREKYQCPRCPYSTYFRGSLTQHSKTHAEQKDFQCIVCKKQFARKTGLDSHVLHNHADNVDVVKTITSKIHFCKSCSFRTVATTLLKRHVRAKHI